MYHLLNEYLLILVQYMSSFLWTNDTVNISMSTHLSMAIFDLLGFLPDNYKLLEKRAYLFSPQYIMEFNFLKFMLMYSSFTMLYQFQVYSKVNQLYIYTPSFRFFSHIGRRVYFLMDFISPAFNTEIIAHIVRSMNKWVKL